MEYMAMNPLDSMATLLLPIRRVHAHNRCKICKIFYSKDICTADEASCFFCKTFKPTDPRMKVLKEAEWHWICSGEDKKAHHRAYVQAHHHWCNHFHVPRTAEEYDYEQELIADEEDPV